MTTLLSDAIVRALGWTLVHSLWQGAALAVLYRVLSANLSKATQRYRAAYLCLSAMFVAALTTFGLVYTPESTGTLTDNLDDSAMSNLLLQIQLSEAGSSFWEQTSHMLEQYYPLLVGVWLLGFGFFLFRVLSGLQTVAHIRKQATLPEHPHWQERIAAIARTLRLSRPVQLLESALVHSPVTLGWLKPVILLPVGFVNQLSPTEVEAVLIHELAHIARQDWVFNLLQALIEAVFYYHPAIWWLSGQIRQERENCCDDAAIAISGNRLIYAKALMHVQEMAKSAHLPVIALGLDGNITRFKRRMPLLARIRRILQQPQSQSINTMEKFVATAILLGLLATLGFRANTSIPSISAIWAQTPALFDQDPPPPPDDAIPAPDSITPPKHIQKITREEDGKKVEMDITDGAITRLNIDGKDIPAADLKQYEKLKMELLQDVAPPPPPPAPGTPPPPPPPPGGFQFNMFAPEVPGIYMFPGDAAPQRIVTDKDANGNQVIRIERDGKPTEIIVKDGAVWIDGREVKVGEPYMLDAPEFQQFERIERRERPELAEMPEFPELPEMPELPGNLDILVAPYPVMPPGYFQMDGFNNPNMYIEGMSKKDRKKFEKEMKQMKKDLDRSQKQYQEMYKSFGTVQYQEEMKRAQDQRNKAMTEQRAAMEDQRQAMLEQRQAMAEQRKAMAEQHHAMMEDSRSQQLSEGLQQQLKKDGLIGEGNYQIRLSGKGMWVDGKQQSAEVHQRYLEIYRKSTGKALKGDDALEIQDEH